MAFHFTQNKSQRLKKKNNFKAIYALHSPSLPVSSDLTPHSWTTASPFHKASLWLSEPAFLQLHTRRLSAWLLLLQIPAWLAPSLLSGSHSKDVFSVRWPLVTWLHIQLLSSSAPCPPSCRLLPSLVLKIIYYMLCKFICFYALSLPQGQEFYLSCLPMDFWCL